MKTPLYPTALSRLPARSPSLSPLARPEPVRACQHIVIVSETFAPDINGVANTLLQLCRGLVAQGYRVSLIRPAPASDRRAGACVVTQGWCHAQLLVTGVPLLGLALLVLPFTLCVAASRVVLGLHYPSDVLAGAIIGSGLGLLGYAVLADVLLG